MINEIIKKAMESFWIKALWTIWIAIGVMAIFFIIVITKYHSDLMDLRSEFKRVEILSEARKNTIIEKDRYIDELKEQIEWSNFLSLILDKDQKVRMDFLDDYVAKNKNGLYKPMEEGLK